ncbi:MAG TPA: hypothetical protein VH912_29120 [Streptosporangiaceae bacterium]
MTPPADLGRVVHAEWIKFRTVRSSFWALLTSAALSIGLGPAFLPTIIDNYDGDPGEAADVAAANGWWFHGLQVGTLAMLILGVLVATAEYASGTIRATLAAVPSRTRVLAAKVACFAAVALVAGAVQAAGAFLIARPFLSGRGIDVPLTDPAAWRGVAISTLAVAAAGLLGLGAGMAIRHTAGAIGLAVAVVMVVVPALAHLLPAGWDPLRIALPSTAIDTMITPTASTLGQGPATAVTFGYVAAVLTVAGALFARRDA